MATDTTLNHILANLVSRVVEAVHPNRILLFGSAARAQMGPHSDIDVLLVMPDGTNRRETLRMAARALIGLGHPKDIIVATEQDLKDLGQDPSLVLNAALSEGREIYSAP